MTTPALVVKYPFDPPGPPECPDVRDIMQNCMTVVWKEPLSDGGSVITGYYVEVRTGVTGGWVKLSKEPLDATSLTYKVTSLTKEKEYSFR